MKKQVIKKLICTIMLCSLIFSNIIPITIAQQGISTENLSNNENITIEISSKIPEQLEHNIRSSIRNIYGKENEDQIYAKVVDIINSAKDRRSLKLHQEDLNRASDWYKDEIIYMFYADEFGVKNKDSKNTFEDLIGMLDYLKQLGVTTIYILPFMDSPMGDAGFDVKNPKNVRKDLGGMEEFSKFIYEARKRGFKIKADLILNHFSDQHKWFQEALNGDIEKLNYFIYTDKAPKFKRYKDQQKGVMIDYYEDDGSVSSRRLIFPDIAESHWRKINIKGKDYYVYHTFYPFQPDINWKNPEVLYEVLDIITYWANLGVDIFRIDAIPYFYKKKGSPSENLEETHEIVKLLSSFLQAIAPKSIMLAEACQWPNDILPYFGQEKMLPPKDILLYFGQEYKIKLNTNKEITRTDQVQVGYHFPIMPAIWASLLTNNNKHFWKALELTPNVPDSSTWALFLRVHDELTLEMVDLETRKLIYDNLVQKGEEFRKGLGVSGRMANFLENDPKRINLAFSILLSMPGMPIIYYGDEIGAQNNFDYAKKAAEEREKVQKEKDKDIEVLSFYDSRDINRGPITESDFENALTGENKQKSIIFNDVKSMIKARKDSYTIRRGKLEQVKNNNNNVLSYLRYSDKGNVLIINNLGNKKVKTKLTLPENIIDKTKISKHITNLLSDKNVNYTLNGYDLTINLDGYEALWLEL
ncbi:MAG: alpha-amylase family glycosyl hydrolase [Vampirovibrionia bacterium]